MSEKKPKVPPPNTTAPPGKGESGIDHLSRTIEIGSGVNDPVPASQPYPSSPESAASPTSLDSFPQVGEPALREMEKPRGLKLNETRAATSALGQVESLHLAQVRITDLEREIERLRSDNEALAAAGETLRRRSGEYLGRAEAAEVKLREQQDFFATEREILKQNLKGKETETENLRSQIESLELRLGSDIKRIRVRERELENRLEIAKLENSSLLRSKDEIILDLKRQIDRLTGETDNYRVKCQELYKQLELNREQFSRTVRALRIALASLEGFENELANPLKKVD